MGHQRKINCIAGQIGDDLHHVRIRDFARIVYFFLEGGHGKAGGGKHGSNRGVDGTGINQGFIALDVDDDVRIFGGCDFGDAVCAGGVVRAGHADACAERAGGLEHHVAIGGNDRAGEGAWQAGGPLAYTCWSMGFSEEAMVAQAPCRGNG